MEKHGKALMIGGVIVGAAAATVAIIAAARYLPMVAEDARHAVRKFEIEHDIDGKKREFEKKRKQVMSKMPRRDEILAHWR